MVKFLDFDKPRNTTQWIIFLAATAITLSSPYGTRAFSKELNKYLDNGHGSNNKVKLTSKNLSQVLHRLKNRRLISIKKEGHKTIIKLTEKGQRKRIEYAFGNMTINKPQSWDGKWRLVIFDIPETHKKLRVSFRNKLKQLGFEQFQKSVWIYPYDCQNEIDFLAELMKISQHLTLITTSINNDKPLKELFKNILKS